MVFAAFRKRFSESDGRRAGSRVRRRRTFVFLHLSLLLTLAPIGAVLYLFGEGDRAALQFFGGQTLVVALIPVLLRFTSSIDKLALFSVLWVNFLIFSTAYNYGGLSAPILAAAILVPVAVFVHLHRLGRILALAGLALGVAVLAYLGVTQHPFPQYLTTEGERALSAVTLLALAAFAFIMGSLALAEQKIHRRRVREMVRNKTKDTRAAEDAQRSAEALARRKTAYMASLGEDLGAPLRSMVGFSQIISRDLLDQGTPDSYRGYAQDIESSGRKLLQVVHAIEDLARHESGNLELAIEGVDLRKIVQDNIAQLQPIAEGRNITVSSVFQTDDVFVAGDEQRLSQMIHHIIANAVQHENFGGTVDVVLGDCEAEFVAISISNHGAVMAGEKLRRVRALFDSDSSPASLDPGQGIGMPLVAALIRLHQGEIEIESGEHKGTVITVKLPRMPDDATTPDQPKTASSFV